MKNVNYRSSELLSCAACGGTVILWVNAALTAATMPYVDGTVVSAVAGFSPSGDPIYTYDISYAEAQLSNPGVGLVESDVLGIACRGTLTAYIDALSSPSWNYIFDQSDIEDAIELVLGGTYLDGQLPVWSSALSTYEPTYIQDLLGGGYVLGDVPVWNGLAFAHSNLANAINSARIRLENNTTLRWKTSTGADFDCVYLDAGDILQLRGYNGLWFVQSDGPWIWSMVDSALLPGSSPGIYWYSIGDIDHELYSVWTYTVQSRNVLYLEAIMDIWFRVNGTVIGKCGSDGFYLESPTIHNRPLFTNQGLRPATGGLSFYMDISVNGVDNYCIPVYVRA